LRHTRKSNIRANGIEKEGAQKRGNPRLTRSAADDTQNVGGEKSALSGNKKGTLTGGARMLLSN